MDYTFDTPGHVSADVRIPSGDVVVRARETGVSTVHIEGDRGDEDITVTCEPTADGGHHLLIEVRDKKTWALFRFTWGQDLEVVLEVPTATDLQVNTGSADLAVRGTVAGIDFRTGSGEARFEDVAGDVKVKTASGDTQGRSVQGHLACHGASGDVEVDRVTGGVTMRTASGDLELGEVDGGAERLQRLRRRDDRRAPCGRGAGAIRVRRYRDRCRAGRGCLPRRAVHERRRGVEPRRRR